MKKKKWVIGIAILFVVLCGTAAGMYYWGASTAADAPVYSADPDAESWSPEQELESDGKSGTKIPGYGTLFFPAGEKEVEMTLYNPEENDSIFVYSLSLEGEETPLYTSGGIEPGKAVRSFTLQRALEAGNYRLKIHITPYDPATGKASNDAVVTAELIVQ